MDRDIFINNSKNNISNKKAVQDESNFFLNAPNKINSSYIQEPMRHLNDYDFNILKEDAYKEVSDEVLKLEYKISKMEDELKDINGQIQSAADINDDSLLQTLCNRKMQIEQELTKYIKIYKEASLSSKLSNGFSDKIKDRFLQVKTKFFASCDKVIEKLPGKLSSLVVIKNSLNKLENINKSVDELMTRQHPYGEASDKYDQLSKYIARANTIQAEISRLLK